MADQQCQSTEGNKDLLGNGIKMFLTAVIVTLG